MGRVGHKMVTSAQDIMQASENEICRTHNVRPFHRSSDFSIQRILHGHFKTERVRLNGKHGAVVSIQEKFQRLSCTRDVVDLQKYDWLKFTRYNPPKLPKSSKRAHKAKRKPGRNPRVPFTPKQLATLENKFQTMKYLTNDDVIALCNNLGLEDKKIKIWFQNRRAREKRKTTQDEDIDVMTVDSECN